MTQEIQDFSTIDSLFTHHKCLGKITKIPGFLSKYKHIYFQTHVRCPANCETSIISPKSFVLCVCVWLAPVCLRLESVWSEGIVVEVGDQYILPTAQTDGLITQV